MRCVLLMLLVLFLPVFSLAQNTAGKKLVVFGDSLSDNGNFGTIVAPLPFPPYFENRFTNGPIAIELAAAAAGLELVPAALSPLTGTNFAFATARARGGDVGDLKGQMSLAFVSPAVSAAPSENIYVFALGGNDIRDARDQDNWRDALQIVRDAARGVEQGLEAALAAGARRILVLNTPPVESIPETSILAGLSGGRTKLVKTKVLTRRFNTYLRRAIYRLKRATRRTGVRIRMFNMYRAVNRVFRSPAEFGLENVTEPCFFTTPIAQVNPACEGGAKVGQFMFLDEIHPNAVVHQVLAQPLAQRLS